MKLVVGSGILSCVGKKSKEAGGITKNSTTVQTKQM